MDEPAEATGAATDLPQVIQRYQGAHDRGDVDAALATFGPTAVVVDDGRTARGPGQIGEWIAATSSEFSWVRTLLEASSSGPGEWLVVQNLTGDFPGGTVDLRYRFTLGDGLIQELVIAP